MHKYTAFFGLTMTLVLPQTPPRLVLCSDGFANVGYLLDPLMEFVFPISDQN